MTLEAQRIAIAEACGWKRQTNPGASDIDLDPFEEWIKAGVRVVEQYLPNYLSDLNAMHEAEKWLLAFRDEHYALYEAKLKRTCTYLSHATAAQRAKAFLRTLKLWIE